jgi:hypothetical protein
MRICPKCNAYHANDLTPFCLVDGTRLVNVEPGSDKWSEGTRVIEEKETELKKQKRKLRWRWIVMSAMTTLILTMIVAKSFTLETTPPPSPSPLPSRLTSPTPTPTARATPTPKPTPTPTPKPTATPTPTLTATPECSDADKSRARQVIIERFGTVWRRNVEAERRKVITENVPVGVPNAEVSLGPIEYQSTFSKKCTASFFVARYVWQITSAVGTKRVPKEKRFACTKLGGNWLCN